MNALRESRILPVALATVAGAGIGRLVGQDTAWTIVGAVIGLGTVAMIVIVGVRPIVAIPVAVGAGIGAYVGGTIVGVLCEPTGCAAFEAGAATVTGIGALIGIGLVVALATRSFDEYNEAIERDRTTPKTGYSSEDAD